MDASPWVGLVSRFQQIAASMTGDENDRQSGSVWEAAEALRSSSELTSVVEDTEASLVRCPEITPHFSHPAWYSENIQEGIINFILNVTRGTTAASELPNGIALRERFCAAWERPDCSIETIVVFDGLALPRSHAVASPSFTVRTLNDDFLKTFFEGVQAGRTPLNRLCELSAIQLPSRVADNPPWPHSYRDFRSNEQVVRDVAHPWPTLLNLWHPQETAGVVGIYERCDSLLTYPRSRGFELKEPTWEPRSHVDPDGNEYNYEVPLRTMYVDDTRKLADFLESTHRQAEHATLAGPRAATALSFFGRFAASYRAWNFGSGDEELEDRMIVDGTTALEAMLLSRGTGKKAPLAERLADLWAESTSHHDLIRSLVGQTYKVRSAIVHGDVRPKRAVINRSIEILNGLLRPTLLAFFHLAGDHKVIASLSTAPGLAASIRSSLPYKPRWPIGGTDAVIETLT